MFKMIKLGLKKKGIVTTKYPFAPYVPFENTKGAPIVDIKKCKHTGQCVKACPVNAISMDNNLLKIDLGSCIFCGACAEICPSKAIKMSKEIELSSKNKEHLTVKFGETSEKTDREDISKLVSKANERIQKIFGRSLSIREVDAGSCNACEVEIYNTCNPIYDVERLGLHVVASPRHADMLVVTGPVTRNMILGLIQSDKATPTPKVIIAMGSCAISGGIFKDSYAVENGVDKIVPVDVYIPGCPPRPEAIIHGILLALNKAEEKISKLST